MGDVKGAARDTNWLYLRKHLYHSEYKSVQYTSSQNVLDLLTMPLGATRPRAQSINPIHPSYPCYNYYMTFDIIISKINYCVQFCLSVAVRRPSRSHLKGKEFNCAWSSGYQAMVDGCCMVDSRCDPAGPLDSNFTDDSAPIHILLVLGKLSNSMYSLSHNKIILSAIPQCVLQLN